MCIGTEENSKIPDIEVAWKVFAKEHSKDKDGKEIDTLQSLQFGTETQYVKDKIYTCKDKTPGFMAFTSEEEAKKYCKNRNSLQSLTNLANSVFHRNIFEFIVEKIYVKDLISIGFAGTNGNEMNHQSSIAVTRKNAISFKTWSFNSIPNCDLKC